MSRFPRTIALALASTALSFAAPALADDNSGAKPAPVSELVDAVNIPYERFTLDNGLKVLIHTDRKAPIVAVSIWYGVGSAHEPEGKTGYAHLFEHIMFNGSENAPGDYFEPLRQIGATDLNGTTWLDRTNYFQTVPKSALEVALFLESDRMGHLLGAVTQEKLDNQIGVVSNEKRQGDNRPYGLVSYRQTELLFPDAHPYGHSTIGSLEDLEAASLDDMKQWFIDHYGPNNAILVLAGDIDAATAKPLVEKWFGAIPKGKPIPVLNPELPTLDAPVFDVMKDKVATTRIYRNWVVPGLNDPDYTPLDVGMTVLGGLASSRLDNIMVREEKNAVAVSAFVLPFVHGSLVQIQADVKPGEDADMVAKRLDDIIADFIENGPTEDEVQRVATRDAAARIAGLEQVGGFNGKATALAQGELYSDDPKYYKKELERLASATPASVTAAMKKWLTRPVVGIRVVPGEREAYEEVESGKGARTGSLTSPAFYMQGDSEQAAPVAVDRSSFPPVGDIPNVDFPDVETATLSNGIKVYFAQRNAVPMTRVTLSFDAGAAADPADKVGLQNFTTAVMEEGTTSLTSVQIAEQQERLGANVSVGGGRDRTDVNLSAVNPNLDASLDLMADIVKNPAFKTDDIERMRVQQLTAIDREESDPLSIATNALPPLMFGDAHPYGRGLSGNGTKESVTAITRNDLVNFHQSWMRPENATIFAVGQIDQQALLEKLEMRFGEWQPEGQPAAGKNFDATIPEAEGKIVVIHRANSPQSMILAGQVLPYKGTDDLLTLNAANEILGGNFLSRINMDLRETKGWSYGTRNTVLRGEHEVPYIMRAPVQTNQTGPAVAAIMGQVKDFLGDNGVTPAELERTVNGNVRQLPGQFEQSRRVLDQMQGDVMFKRPSNYAETVADRYKALTADDLNQAMASAIDPDKFTWVIVGDADKIKTQLEALDMPIEYRGYEAGNTDVSKAGSSDDSAVGQD
jgi:predicted Zn-dependent peptidase